MRLTDDHCYRCMSISPPSCSYNSSINNRHSWFTCRRRGCRMVLSPLRNAASSPSDVGKESRIRASRSASSLVAKGPSGSFSVNTNTCTPGSVRIATTSGHSALRRREAFKRGQETRWHDERIGDMDEPCDVPKGSYRHTLSPGNQSRMALKHDGNGCHKGRRAKTTPAPIYAQTCMRRGMCTFTCTCMHVETPTATYTHTPPHKQNHHVVGKDICVKV
jgi:hypothetical protein